MTHEYWMKEALKLAERAAAVGEIPVGAIVVINNQRVGEGWNQSILNHDPSAHAEMIAIRQAAKRVGNYRLINADLYVTLEPCSMCAGLLVHSRVARIIFGASDYKTGAAGSIMNLVQHPNLNHQAEIVGGILENECANKLSDFFKQRREEKKRLKLAMKEAGDNASWEES
ncbi:tRNA adenosine(34) deaminase TadA [Alteromonas sp. a30]|uniref:tRNA adenosine(34) deaminase TadA n=1 Tax=Alteromonas sp. a30 TaxID=2730917 RepID=UPI00227FD05D|nr:tRNA adenosine(34) deaminase TadA [Alteromonas sp. a30]MCY7294577.1 tRNA adenosine(34) deaminase TadA [Alteromonas sp. a30]